MSKLHPATKAANKILKKAGFDTFIYGTLSIQIMTREYNEYPLIVDVRCSSQVDNLARFEVCHLYDKHTEYAKVAKLHNVEFTF